MANSLDPDEAAHNELPHLGLHCLPNQVIAFVVLQGLKITLYTVCTIVH